MDVTAGGESADDESSLMARLQSQFGDINVTAFLSKDDCAADDEEGGAEEPPGSDDESSLEEPDPEELRAWQEEQFRRGKSREQARGVVREAASAGSSSDARKSALRRRRRDMTAPERTLRKEGEAEDDEERERVAIAPDLGGEASHFFPEAISDVGGSKPAGGAGPLLCELALRGDPDVLGTKWSRLYSSAGGDGLSFRCLCEEIRGYNGPTVLLVGGTPSASKCLVGNGGGERSKRVALGFFAMDPWTESTDSFGENEDCFLFAIDEDAADVKIFRPKARTEADARAALPGEGGTSGGPPADDAATAAPGLASPHHRKRYMHCRPSSLALTDRRRQAKGGVPETDGSIRGIGVGGTPSHPRLHLTETLEECRALPHDALFDDGDLLLGRCDQSLYYFDADVVEVWGVGGEEWIEDAKAARRSKHDVSEANRERARKVDKAQFLDDFQSGMVWKDSVNPTLFGHRDLVGERCEM